MVGVAEDVEVGVGLLDGELQVAFQELSGVLEVPQFPLLVEQLPPELFIFLVYGSLIVYFRCQR